jgi:hypothetical protein
MEKLHEYKNAYIEKISKDGQVPRKGVMSKLFFSWITPFVKIGDKLPIEFDMMPQLSEEFKHKNYSSKIREHFQKNVNDFDKNKTKNKKFFVLKLILGCFKWDIFLSLLLEFSVEIFGYSTAFFVQNILEIKTNFSQDLYVKVFLAFISAMFFCKFCSVLSSQYTNYFIVR